MDKKYELKPGVFANKEQIKAIDMLHEYLSSNSNEPFMLTGRGGTGKTTIIKKVLEPFHKQRIGAIALAGKAVEILRSAILDARISFNVEAKTIASALGMNMDMETGKFFYDKGNMKELPIEGWSIIIVDEASMVNEEAYRLIMEQKQRSAKVIFMGDNVQLPPIREYDSKFKNFDSPVFSIPKQAKLVERMRQGEESPILKITDLYAENVESSNPVLDPLPEEKESFMIDNERGVIFTDKIKFLEMAVDEAKKGYELRDINHSKIIVYKNYTKSSTNNYIRNQIFGNDAIKMINVGEHIILNNSFKVSRDSRIENAIQLLVVDIEETQRRFEELVIKEYILKFDGILYEGRVVHEDSIEDYQKKLQSFKEKALKSVNPNIRSKHWRDYYDFKGKFMDFDYAYALTSHKSQGSTFKNVFVVENDILDIKAIDNRTKSQSLYVATSRASHKLIMLK